MVTFYGSSLLDASVPAGQELEIKGASRPGLVTKNGLVVFGNDGKMVSAHPGKHEHGWNNFSKFINPLPSYKDDFLLTQSILISNVDGNVLILGENL